MNIRHQDGHRQPAYDWNDWTGFDIRWTGYMRTALGWEVQFTGYLHLNGQRHYLAHTAEEVGQLMGGN